jgi:hypothetical protein
VNHCDFEAIRVVNLGPATPGGALGYHLQHFLCRSLHQLFRLAGAFAPFLIMRIRKGLQHAWSAGHGERGWCRVEEIQVPLMQKIRYLDKLINSPAIGKSLEKVLHH